MSKITTIHGFVLKRKNLLEQDILVTIYTKEFGKTSMLGKGVRTLTSKRAAHLQTGNLIQAQVRKSKDILYLQSSKLISGFLSLRTEKCIDQIYLFLFIVDGLMPEGQQDIDVFKTVQRFFIQLSKQESSASVLKANLQKLLELQGYVDEKLSLSHLIQIAENHIEKVLPRHVII